MVLFNLIFRLLSNVILVIRNGCLPKFRHLQSTVNKLLENSAATLIWKLYCKTTKKRGGGLFMSLLNTHSCKHTPSPEAPHRRWHDNLNATGWNHGFSALQVYITLHFYGATLTRGSNVCALHHCPRFPHHCLWKPYLHSGEKNYLRGVYFAHISQMLLT